MRLEKIKTIRTTYMEDMVSLKLMHVQQRSMKISNIKKENAKSL